MFSKAQLTLTLLAASLALSSARPADVVAHVPSNYYSGTKWVLFRDDSIPDPPPNVIQGDGKVQVLPTYRYNQQQQFQGYVSTAPVHVQLSPLHLDVPQSQSDYDSVVVQGKSALPVSTPTPQVSSYKVSALPYSSVRVSSTPRPIFSSFEVTAVPQTAVHVQGPSYFDYLRKKKNAN